MVKKIGWREFGFTGTIYAPSLKKATLSGLHRQNPFMIQKGDVDVIQW